MPALLVALVLALPLGVHAAAQPAAPPCRDVDPRGAAWDVSFPYGGDDVRAWGWGAFETELGRRHVAALCPGTRLTIEVTRRGVRHDLTYWTSRDGHLNREYRVGVRVVRWGRDADRLEAHVLPHVVRHLSF